MLWDPTISVVSAIISVASVSIYPHFGTGFPEICFVLSWQALPERIGIPKLVSLAYYFWLKFVSSSNRSKNSTIGSLIPCLGRRSRNRWASDDLQDAQRDRQTQEASSSSAHLAIFLLCLVFQEWMVQVAITGGKSVVPLEKGRDHVGTWSADTATL
jgi:hypothetical protein